MVHRLMGVAHSAKCTPVLHTVAKAFPTPGHVPALRGLDLDLPRGRFLTVFGPNGAGKTTLIKVLSTTRQSAHVDSIMRILPRIIGLQ